MAKVYMAGPMRGIPNFNFPTFKEAAAVLRSLGHYVFNPAEGDILRHGTDISNAEGSEAQAAVEHGFSLRQALAEDTHFICMEAEVIALLPGWEKSKGARAELALSNALGHAVWLLDKSIDGAWYVRAADFAGTA